MMATLTTPWTPEEENKLRELILGAKNVEVIARLLNRTPLAVCRRASMLRLTVAKRRAPKLTCKRKLVFAGAAEWFFGGRK
jgi:hypothetical protein